MAGVKGRSGGKRPGAGRPPKYNDCPTKVMRVPKNMAGHIRSLLDLADDWVNYAKTQSYAYWTKLTKKAERIGGFDGKSYCF